MRLCTCNNIHYRGVLSLHMFIVFKLQYDDEYDVGWVVTVNIQIPNIHILLTVNKYGEIFYDDDVQRQDRTP